MRYVYLVGNTLEEAKKYGVIYLQKIDAETATVFFNAPDNEAEDVPRKLWRLDLNAVTDAFFEQVV